MSKNESDWKPTAESVLEDQTSAFDTMRGRCPVAHDGATGWTLFNYRDVLRVAEDAEGFSNIVSTHVSVPNGMDPPVHGKFRAAIDSCFEAQRMQEFEPICRSIAVDLVQGLPRNQTFDWIEQFGEPFAACCQCAFLGWPMEDSASIIKWTRRNHQASRTGDRATLGEVASEFSEFVGDLLASRRTRQEVPDEENALQLLLNARIDGKPFSTEELVSVLRNWTVGEVGSLAMSTGIIVWHLAQDVALYRRIQTSQELIPAVNEEVLRCRGPLVANRRRATREVVVGGRQIAKGDLVSVNWVSANRDPNAFEAPNQVRLGRPELPKSLLYGAGIHVCPGAPLARLQLRVAIETLLQTASELHLARDSAVRNAVFPENGFSQLPVRIS